MWANIKDWTWGLLTDGYKFCVAWLGTHPNWAFWIITGLAFAAIL